MGGLTHKLHSNVITSCKIAHWCSPMWAVSPAHLDANNLLPSTCPLHDGYDRLVSLLQFCGNFLGDLDILFCYGSSVVALRMAGQAQVVLGGSVLFEQGKSSVINVCVEDLVFGLLDHGNIQVVTGWAEILILLVGEDVERHNVSLGVPVLASLRCGHLDALARKALDHEMGALPDFTSLHGIRVRCTRITGLEGWLIINLCHGSHKTRRRCQNTGCTRSPM